MFDLIHDLQFAAHGGGDSAGGVAGLVADILAFAERLVALSSGDMIASLLPGVSVMSNLHPLWVHFPIALLTLFLIADMLGAALRNADWRTFASGLLYIGTVFAGITMAAGLIAADSVVHGGDVHDIMENHEHLGISVFLLSLALSIWRWFGRDSLEGAANGLFLTLGALLVALLLFTADLGGYMVYRFGVAVEAAEAANQAAARQHMHGGLEESESEHHHGHGDDDGDR